MALAIANGLLREATYGRQLSELRAHQLSTLVGMGIMACAVRLFSLWRPLASWQQAAAIGVLWLVLTVAFEFLFGHFVAGHAWSRLFRDYNILAGRLWALLLLWILLLPYIVFMLQGF